MDVKYLVIIDDDADFVRMLEINLKQDGFRVKGILKLDNLFAELMKEAPDLILLDLLMPGMNGFEVLDKLKRNNKLADIPVIMLSGKGENENKVAGLTLGSDDYLVKPFSMDELHARIRAVLRRSSERPPEKPQEIRIGENLRMDATRFEVFVKNEKIILTPVEFKILECLAGNKGKVFNRDEILEHLWGEKKNVVDRTIDVHIRHLRQKLGSSGELIKNIRGMGYKIEE